MSEFTFNYRTQKQNRIQFEQMKKIIEKYRRGIPENVMIDKTKPLMITPISQCLTRPSRINFDEQMRRLFLTRHMLWDNSWNNATQAAGGLYCFADNGQIYVTQVTDVISSDNALDSWIGNIGVRNRTVLKLTGIIMTISMDDWVAHGGYDNYKQTTRVKMGRQNLLNYIEEKFQRM